MDGHGVEDLDGRIAAGGDLRGVDVVSEHDPVAQLGAHDVVEERIERRPVVVEGYAVVQQVRGDELGHEGLELEVGVGVLVLLGPPLDEADRLGPVVGAALLAGADEVEVQGDAGEETVAGVLRHEVTAVVCVALVEDRHDVDDRAGALERDRGALRPGLHLLRVDEALVGSPKSVDEPGHEVGVVDWRVAFLHLHHDVEVVDRAQRGAFGDGAGVAHLHHREVGVFGDLLLQPRPHSAARLRDAKGALRRAPGA